MCDEWHSYKCANVHMSLSIKKWIHDEITKGRRINGRLNCAYIYALILFYINILSHKEIKSENKEGRKGWRWNWQNGGKKGGELKMKVLFM